MHPLLTTSSNRPTRHERHRARESSTHVVLAAVVFLAAASAAAWSATIRVPSEHATIQAAINAASTGDSILVAPGTYVENLDTRGKPLVLRSELGPASTIIDGGGQARVLNVSGGGTIEGFTIRNGYDYSVGGGICVRGAAPTAILDNVIEANAVGEFDVGTGGGIFCSPETNVRISGNIIRGNYAGDSGGGIWDWGAVPGNTISNNTIEGNWCHVCGAGIRTDGNSVIKNNLIRENTADSFGAGICIGGGSTIENNTVVGNVNGNRTFVHGAGIHVWDGAPAIRWNVVVANHGVTGLGAGLRCGGGRSLNAMTRGATTVRTTCWLVVAIRPAEGTLRRILCSAVPIKGITESARSRCALARANLAVG